MATKSLPTCSASKGGIQKDYPTFIKLCTHVQFRHPKKNKKEERERKNHESSNQVNFIFLFSKVIKDVSKRIKDNF